MLLPGIHNCVTALEKQLNRSSTTIPLIKRNLELISQCNERILHHAVVIGVMTVEGRGNQLKAGLFRRRLGWTQSTFAAIASMKLFQAKYATKRLFDALNAGKPPYRLEVYHEIMVKLENDLKDLLFRLGRAVGHLPNIHRKAPPNRHLTATPAPRQSPMQVAGGHYQRGQNLETPTRLTENNERARARSPLPLGRGYGVHVEPPVLPTRATNPGSLPDDCIIVGGGHYQQGRNPQTPTLPTGNNEPAQARSPLPLGRGYGVHVESPVSPSTPGSPAEDCIVVGGGVWVGVP